MSIALLSESFGLLPAASAAGGEGYASRERTQWDSDSFEYLLQGSAFYVARDADTSAPSVTQETEATDMMAATSNVATPLHAATAKAGGGGASTGSADGMPWAFTEGANAMPPEGAVQMLGNREYSTPEPQDLEPDSPGRAVPPSNNETASGGRLTIAISGCAVSVAVQDAGLPDGDLESLRSLIERELSWTGLALRSMKVNGAHIVNTGGSGVSGD